MRLHAGAEDGELGGCHTHRHRTRASHPQKAIRLKNFMVQGGDPLGEGYGGESAWGGKFDDEINKSSPLYQGGYDKGTIAMANAGPNTNGSQFFIMHIDYPLPPSYTKFGKVIEGQDVVNAIAEVETNHRDKPIVPVVMQKVYIEE